MITLKSPELATLRAELESMSFENMASVLSKTDDITRFALNLHRNNENELFAQVIIDRALRQKNSPLRKNTEDAAFIFEALTALAVNPQHQYDVGSKYSPSILQSVMHSLFTYAPSDDFKFCSDRFSKDMLAHVASRVSDINQCKGDRIGDFVKASKVGELSALMRAAMLCDIEAVRILIECGADPESKNENGVNCNTLIEDRKDRFPVFYLNYKALMLTLGQQASAPLTSRRGL